MCGIAGIFRRRGLDGSGPRRLRAMTNTILHRGPDDHGYLLLDSRDGSFTLGQEIPLDRRCDVLLGSRRLSIIDTSPAGRQPMTGEERDVFVVFNGEIYNYLELRRDLQAPGHRHMDHPASSGQVLPRWQLMELATQHVKVILEGQGSNEMLAGYVGRYFGPWFRDELHNLAPRDLLRASGRLTAAIIERYRRSGWNPLRAVAGRLFPMFQRHRRIVAASERALTPAFCELGRQSAGRPSDEPRRGDRLTNALLNDHSQGILPRLLMFGDAIRMGRSLESRLPFLDYRLVEFVFGLPARWKFDGIESKVILKRSLKDVLPSEILMRRDKIGFGTPIDQWIRDCLDSEVRPLLLSSRARSREIFDSAEIEKTLARFAGGDTAGAGLIFSWISIEIWFRVFIDGEGTAACRP